MMPADQALAGTKGVFIVGAAVRTIPCSPFGHFRRLYYCFSHNNSMYDY